MAKVISTYCVVKPYDENSLKQHYPHRIKTLLSKFNTKNYEFTPAEFIRDFKKLTIPTCSITSYRSALQIALKSGLDEKILIRKTGESHTPEWFKHLESVIYWQEQLRSSKYYNLEKRVVTTQSTYLSHLWSFNCWLSKKSFIIKKVIHLENNLFKTDDDDDVFSNVQKLLQLLDNPFTKDSDAIKIIKKYMLDPIHAGKKPSSMNVTFCSILSYFDKNDHPIKMKFNTQTKYDKQQQVDEEISFSLSDFMKILTVGKPSITEKAVFLCKFQRGLDASTLADRFNFQALDQINKYFKTDNHVSWNLDLCPVPVKLVRMKTGFSHVGFLDRDAIVALQDYLDFIKSKNIILDKALFVNKFGNPISDSWISGHFFNLTVRSGIQKINPNYNKGFRYVIGSHELRDLLKSTLIDSGCRIDVVDHVIGHASKDSYEKQTKLYPETMRKEYAKASKQLNIFTKFTSIVNGTDDTDELKLQLKDVLEKRLDGEAEQIRNEKFVIEQQRQMKQLQDTVNDLLKKGMNQPSRLDQ